MAGENPGTGIDWGKLANQPVSQTSGIDWNKLVGQSAAPTQSVPEDKLIHSQSQPGTIEADQHPVEHRVDDLLNDVKYGPGVNDNRLPERAMRAVGFRGTETGGTGSAGAAMPISAAVEGIPQLIHAATRVPQVKSFNNAEGVTNEGLGGGLKILAGVAPFVAPEAMPMAVPSVAEGGVAGTVAGGAAKLAGASPETQDLISTGASIAAPGLAGPVGRGMQEHAPAIGKAAGYGTTAATMSHSLFGKGHTINPLDILFATKPATAGVSAISRGAGKLIEAGDPTQDLGLTSSPRGVQTPGPEILPPQPKQLPRGPIQLPGSPDEPGRLVNAQPAIVKDTNTGRMRKQFLPTESTGKPVYPQKLVNTGSNPTPQAPPNTPQTESGLSSSALRPKLVESSGEPTDNEKMDAEARHEASKVSPFQNSQSETAPPETGQSEPGNGRTTYASNLDDAISTYQQVLKQNPNNAEAAKTLQGFLDLRDQINQPGYSNPLIDPTGFVERRATPRQEVTPNPNGTATDISAGQRKKIEIPVTKLENPNPIDLDRGKNQPYVPVPKRGPQLIQGGSKPPLATTLPGGDDKVLPGDYQLIHPTTVYHGSNSPNLINTGVQGRMDPDFSNDIKDLSSGKVEDQELEVPGASSEQYKGVTPEDFRGVFFNYDSPSSEVYGPVHGLRLPAKSLIRQEPFLEENIFKGDVPSGAVNTKEDLIHTRGLLQQLRQDLEKQRR